MTDETNVGTIVPETAYGLIFHDNQEVEVIAPSDPEGQLTDGHLLMIGLVHLLKQEGFAQNIIDQTGEQLLEIQREATASEG